MKSPIRVTIFFIFTFMCFTSCKVYKFTGASTTAATVSIGNFPNLAPIQANSLSTTFIDNLRDKVLRETRLRLENNNAEVSFTGSIQNYYVSPAAVSGTEDVSENRLTIAIQVDYIDTIEPEKSFSQLFRDGENYDASQTLTDVEDDLIQVITERIAESIFNRAFVNW